MKKAIVALLLLLSLLATSSVFAGDDDVKWIAQCMMDNKDANVSTEVIQKYCTCMNNKMDSSETLSITEWEKTHPNERAACDKEAGWR